MGLEREHGLNKFPLLPRVHETERMASASGRYKWVCLLKWNSEAMLANIWSKSAQGTQRGRCPGLNWGMVVMVVLWIPLWLYDIPGSMCVCVYVYIYICIYIYISTYVSLYLYQYLNLYLPKVQAWPSNIGTLSISHMATSSISLCRIVIYDRSGNWKTALLSLWWKLAMLTRQM